MNPNPATPLPARPKEDVVLKVENLGKKFKLYPSQSGRIKEWLTFGRRSYHNDFWALSDLSFDVRRGEFVGVIGQNGAGKSTLLKVLTGVLEPSQGSYWTSGRVLSLLELSGGMDDDLTGRENVIRSTQLLGFPDEYASQRMKQIAEFAELEEFFDAPLSVYSSGMRIRLAFSLFAFMDCDILILDEVLAVGDIFFSQKCYARLEELINKNTTIMLVSHSMNTILRYCRSVILLDHGRLVFKGKAEKAIQRFMKIKSSSGVWLDASDTYLQDSEGYPYSQVELLDWPSEAAFKDAPQPAKLSTSGAQLTRMAVCDKEGQPCTVFRQGEKAFLYYEYSILDNMGVPVTEFNLMTVQNLRIHSRNSLKRDDYDPPRSLRAGDVLRYKQVIHLDLAPGEYIFGLDLFSLHPDDYGRLDFFSQGDLLERLVNVSRSKQAGVIQVYDASEGARDIHVGMFNLGGEASLQLLRTDDRIASS